MSPTRGVRQGDPLSGTLFNIIIEEVLMDLCPNIGIDLVGGQLSNHIAYADDVTLFASSRPGISTLFRSMVERAGRFGLDVNLDKCRILQFRGLGKIKMVLPRTEPLDIGGMLIPGIGRDEIFSYMGVEFRYFGLHREDLVGLQTKILKSVLKAPLKPQQKLWAIRNITTNRILAKIPFYTCSNTMLRTLDIGLKRALRDILKLPADSPNAFFFAPLCAGGLGLLEYRLRGPLLRRNRLESFINNFSGMSDEILGWADDAVKDLCSKLGRHGISTGHDINLFYQRELYGGNDGKDLNFAGKVTGQHRWLLKSNRFLSGRDFINLVKLRINALPSRVRMSRGRNTDRSCQVGCDSSETTYHMIQACPKTHELRIKRHNNLVGYIAKRNTSRDSNVIIEPRIQTKVGLRKPDMVIIRDGIAHVLDAQITKDDGNALRTFNSNKVRYYKSNPCISKWVRENYGVSEVSFGAVTISYKGLWCPHSIDYLLKFHLIRPSDAYIIPTRVGIGSVICFRYHGRST